MVMACDSSFDLSNTVGEHSHGLCPRGFESLSLHRNRYDVYEPADFRLGCIFLGPNPKVRTSIVLASSFFFNPNPKLRSSLVLVLIFFSLVYK